jgi:drug/metabolite transporter (DMT)-like permease
MPDPARRRHRKSALAWAITLAAGVVGLAAGYDFGNRLAGMWIGALMAANGALFCSLLAAAAVDRLLPGRERAGASAAAPTSRDDSTSAGRGDV